jgi:hypothetical protein
MDSGDSQDHSKRKRSRYYRERGTSERKRHMINIDLLCRPWSGHYPRVKDFSPLIKADIEKISTSRKTGWRCQVWVDDSPMFTSHHPTKSWAEHEAGRMLRAYTDAHYISK